MPLNVQVPPVYPNGCQLVFCGEAVSKPDLLAKVPFAANAGKVIRRAIHASGLNIDEVGFTHVVKRPPDSGFDADAFTHTFYTTRKEGRVGVTEPSEELLGWYSLLREELLARRPTVVVACGNEALRCLCGVNSIYKHRGSILPSSLVEGLKVVPIVHPQQIAGQWQELYITSEILRRKVVPQLRTKELTYAGWSSLLRPTIDDWEGFVRSCNDVPVALDIETRAGSIACIGVAALRGSSEYAICVPIQTTTGPYFERPEDEQRFWVGLQALCDRNILIAHNAFYDIDWLRDYGIIPGRLVDTMLLFHRLYPELPKGLDFVSMWFTDIPYYKDDGKTWGRNKPDEQLWEYNLKDCVATLRAYYAMQQLKESPYGPYANAAKLYETHTAALLPIAFEMQSLGLDASAADVEFTRSVLSAELAKIRVALDVASGGKLVTRAGNKKITDAQVLEYLYGDLKLPPKRNRKTGALTADEDALVELLIQFPELHVLKALNAERKFGKALNSYVDIKWEA